MHKLQLLIAIIACFAAMSCEETPPTIVPCQTDRVVLVEEFTGMQCPNCPTGHRKIKELQTTYPGKIISIAIHADDYFSEPQQGKDFRTVDGDKMEKEFKPAGYPSLLVNRKFYESQGDYELIDPITWAGPIADELCLPSDASIAVNSTYDNASRAVSVTVDVGPTNSVKMKEAVGLTVLITENKVIGPQEGPTGWDYNYEHNHMLRDIITDTWGDRIQEKGATLKNYQKVLTYTLPAGWDADNCHVVAFVHYQGVEKYILQATETSLVP